MNFFELLNGTKYLILFAFLVTGPCLHAQVPTGERRALLDFYERTDGKQWTRTWDLERPVTEWQGITVRDGHVTALELFMNNLNGKVPESIGDLGHLVTLDLAFNLLSGELPQGLASLRNLRTLKLEMNRIRGRLPDDIGKLRNLEELTAFNNFLSGKIPTGIGKLENLRILNLSSNDLKGEIPGTMGNLGRLEILGLFDNALDGPIPRELGNLAGLRELVLANNRLGGEIPAEFGQLASLEVLQIQNNRFDSYRNLERMQTEKFLVFDYDRADAKRESTKSISRGPGWRTPSSRRPLATSDRFQVLYGYRPWPDSQVVSDSP